MEDYLSMHRPGCFEKYGPLRMCALKRHNMFFPSTFAPPPDADPNDPPLGDLEEINFDMLTITKLQVPASDHPEFVVSWEDGQSVWFRARSNEVRAVWVDALYPFLALKRSLGEGDSFFPTFPVPLLYAKIILECIAYIDSRDHLTEYQVMRKSAVSKDVQALYWRLLEGKGLPEKCDVHTVTNVVKPLLSGLPETLLTRALYAKFMSLAPKAGEREEGSVDSHRKLDGLIRQLPTLNRLLLGRLMRLAADIAANEAKNSMTASSMGVLLGPCILLSDDPFELRNLKKTAIPALMVIIHQTIAGAVFSQAEMDQDIDEVREDLASERHPENLVNALRGKKSIFDCLQLQLQGGDEPLLPDMRSSSALIAGKPEVRLAALLGIAQNKAVGSSLAVCNPNTLDGLDHKSLLGMESLPDQSVLDQWKAGKEVLCTFKLEGHDLKKYLEALPVDAVLTGLKVVREKVDEGSFLVTQVVLNGCELDLSPQEKHHLESMDSTAKLVETKESSDSEEDTEKKLTRVVSSSTSTDKLPSKEQTANLDPQRQPIIISISLKGAHGEMGGYPDVRRLPEYTETKVTLLDAVTGFVAAREKKVENKVGPAEKVSDTAEKSGQVKEGADMGEKKVEEVKEGKDKVTAVSAESDQPDLRKPSRSSTVGSDGIDSLLHHSPTEPITSISAADLPMSSSFSVDEPDRTGFPSSSSTSTSEDEDHAEHTGAASSSSSSSPSASTQHARS